MNKRSIFETTLKICTLNIIFEYLYNSEYSCGELELMTCNKYIHELLNNKIMKSVEFKLTELSKWSIDRLNKIECLCVDIHTNLIFFSQLFPKLKSLNID